MKSHGQWLVPEENPVNSCCLRHFDWTRPGQAWSQDAEGDLFSAHFIFPTRQWLVTSTLHEVVAPSLVNTGHLCGKCNAVLGGMLLAGRRVTEDPAGLLYWQQAHGEAAKRHIRRFPPIREQNSKQQVWIHISESPCAHASHDRPDRDAGTARHVSPTHVWMLCLCSARAAWSSHPRYPASVALTLDDECVGSIISARGKQDPDATVSGTTYTVSIQISPCVTFGQVPWRIWQDVMSQSAPLRGHAVCLLLFLLSHECRSAAEHISSFWWSWHRPIWRPVWQRNPHAGHQNSWLAFKFAGTVILSPSPLHFVTF